MRGSIPPWSIPFSTPCWRGSRTTCSTSAPISCTPDTGAKLDYEPLRVIDAQVERLEREIDELNASLKPLRSFVLPGGSPASAALHLARTVSRRAERLMVELAATPGEVVGGPALRYMNRLSDFLFVASRTANNEWRGGRALGSGQESLSLIAG